ncbi:MAG: hypothetical protein LBC97_10770 [Bifidobacteriaceae bacterium]|nr:hypothetical protein [Bifidobacteriaceae bacterium]
MIELDKLFWGPDLQPTPPGEWQAIQRDAAAGPCWVIDGDLGPRDSHLVERLAAADAIVILEHSLLVCVWRAVRRSRENREFWRRVLGYRSYSLPAIRAAITSAGRGDAARWLRNPADAERFLATTGAEG